MPCQSIIAPHYWGGNMAIMWSLHFSAATRVLRLLNFCSIKAVPEKKGGGSTAYVS